ncbi:MAG: PorT family protein [Prevotella sp.]|nr:PorT family protein [Prevotella sp.]
MKKILTANQWKKVICLSFIICHLPFNEAQAQVSFGIKGGLNETKLSLNQSDLEESISNKSGFFIGPTVRFTLPILSLGMDAAVLYDQREAEVKDTGEKLQQKSVQIPIHARYGFGLGAFASLYLYAGPQFGFNVGGDTEKQKVSDWSLKTANISGNAGLGLMFANHLQVSINYNFALSKNAEYKIIKDGVEDNAKVKNNAWQIALAYYF